MKNAVADQKMMLQSNHQRKAENEHRHNRILRDYIHARNNMGHTLVRAWRRIMRKLRRSLIASDERLTKDESIRLLPPSWAMLYEITRCKGEQFDRLIESGSACSASLTSSAVIISSNWFMGEKVKAAYGQIQIPKVLEFDRRFVRRILPNYAGRFAGRCACGCKSAACLVFVRRGSRVCARMTAV